MWPKNATVVGFNPKTLKITDEQLQAARFVPCTDHQAVSMGFSPVRDGEMHVTVPNHELLRLTIEKKVLPSSAISLLVDERAAALEKDQGFAPGKKQRKELRERIIDEQLPRALTIRRHHYIWLDYAKGRMVIDSTVGSVVDDIQRLFYKSFEGISLADVKWPRTKMMTSWLEEDEAPKGFTIDQDAELHATGESRAAVRYVNHTLDPADIGRHIKAGKQCTRLAMTFDDRVSFVLTEDQQLRRIRPLDIIKEAEGEYKDADRFDGEFALMRLELSRLLDAISGAA